MINLETFGKAWKSAKELLTFEGNTELVKRHNVEGTPFVIITTKGVSFVTIGKHRVSEPMKTEKEAIRYVEDRGWTLIFSVLEIYVDLALQLREAKKNQAAADKIIEEYDQQKQQDLDSQKK